MQEHNYNSAIAQIDSCLSLNKKNILAYLNRGFIKASMIDYIESIDSKTKSSVKIRTSINKNSSKQIIIDYSGPIEDFSTCIEMNSNFVFARFNRANCYAKSLQIDKAIEDYTKVIALEPSFAQAYFNRGLLYIYKNEIDKAAADLSKSGEFGIVNSYNILNRYCIKKEK